MCVCLKQFLSSNQFITSPIVIQYPPHSLCLHYLLTYIDKIIFIQLFISTKPIESIDSKHWPRSNLNI